MRAAMREIDQRMAQERALVETGSILCCYLIFIIVVIVVIICLFPASSDDCTLILQHKFKSLATVLYIITSLLGLHYFLPESWKPCQHIFSVATCFIFILYTFMNDAQVQKGGGEVLPGIAYKEYRLTSYNQKLQDRINDPNTWGMIDKCLHRYQVCEKMKKHRANLSFKQFQSKPLSAIESGCCKPSNDCNFSYVSATNWMKMTTNQSEQTNSDCDAWNNNPKVLCFNCNSCKAGVLDKYKDTWLRGILALIH